MTYLLKLQNPQNKQKKDQQKLKIHKKYKTQIWMMMTSQTFSNFMKRDCKKYKRRINRNS